MLSPILPLSRVLLQRMWVGIARKLSCIHFDRNYPNQQTHLGSNLSVGRRLTECQHYHADLEARLDGARHHHGESGVPPHRRGTPRVRHRRPGLWARSGKAGGSAGMGPSMNDVCKI